MTRLTATCPLTVLSMSFLLAACGTSSDPVCLADCDGGVDARDAGVACGELVADSPCERAFGAWPLHSAEARWGVRVDLPTKPFDVTEIRYDVLGGTPLGNWPMGVPSCDTVSGHDVELYVAADEGALPEAPAARSLRAPDDPEAGDEREVVLAVDLPLRVEEGQSFFVTWVAIRPGMTGSFTCLPACPDLAADARGVVSAVQTNTFWLTQLEAYGPGAGSRYDVAVRGNAPCP